MADGDGLIGRCVWKNLDEIYFASEQINVCKLYVSSIESIYSKLLKFDLERERKRKEKH